MSVSMMLDETADAFRMRVYTPSFSLSPFFPLRCNTQSVYTCLARLDAANHKYALAHAGRTIFKGLLEPFCAVASPLLLAESLDHTPQEDFIRSPECLGIRF